MDMIGTMSLGQIWDAIAHTHAQRTALIFEAKSGGVRSYTYAAMDAAINRTANLFLSLGIQKNHKVAAHLNNSPEFLFCLFALAKIGAVLVPLNVHFLHDECSHILQKCDIDTVVTEAQFLPLYQQILAGQHGLRHVLVVNAGAPLPELFSCFQTLVQQQPEELIPAQPVYSHDVAEILFTSGTTSAPKGVVITHHNLIFAGYYTAWQCALRSDDVYLTSMPAFHIDCQCTAAMPTFVSGATFVLLEKYSARNFWASVCLHRATITECIPRIMRTLMLQPSKAWEKQHNLRDVFFYLTLSDEEKDAFVERFGVRLLTSYGMTETIVGIIGDRPGDARRWPSLGRVGMGYEARVVGCDGCDVPLGTVGELLIKGEPGKTLFKEYYNDPAATARAYDAQGWLHTGDSVYADKDGYYYFVDRNVNMIKRCGENISCTEVENILVAHPDIMEAAVVGVPDELCDEQVVAFVVPKDNATITVAELADYASARLAKFKLPSTITLVENLPRTSTGKVQKFLLKQKITSTVHECPGDIALTL